MMTPLRSAFCLALALLGPLVPRVEGQATFTHADTLRGAITPERAWWDVAFYDLHVTLDPADSTIRGRNGITYRVTDRAREMQIDLQTPLQVDSMVQDGRRVPFRRDGHAFFARVRDQKVGTTRTLTVYYQGRPRVAENPPWDGGLIWARDPNGATWISTACQGLGASVWWPTKDTQADEPDSQRVVISVPDSLQAVGNGRLRAVERGADGRTSYEWFVSDPINNYAVSAYIGRYTRIDETLEGENGPLTVTLWPLTAHLDPARAQFTQVRPVLRCFEQWFGPYPWYRDGYQLVEAPHLGMEHQSAVAYGNGFTNGYKGKDFSGTGWGLTWDFIIVHETAHEWFGNNITTADIADMWVHEGFANYSESLYTECRYGTAAGAAYVIGTRPLVQNDQPVVGSYGVNRKGSGDMYTKGGNMLHTIRQVVDDDERWVRVLRGLNSEFRHRIVTGKQVQDYISTQAGIRLDRVFAQYLTTTKLPVFEYRLAGSRLTYRWSDVVRGFDMPMDVVVSGDSTVRLRPTETWQTTDLPLAYPEDFRLDPSFYVVPRRRA